ncbi:MAG: hypothetical protein ACK5L5_07220 [Bacteroidales bacterium]
MTYLGYFKWSAFRKLAISLVALTAFYACSDDEQKEPYIFQKTDITIEEPPEGFTAEVEQLFKLTAQSVSNEGMSYQWLIDSVPTSDSKTLETMFNQGGEYKITFIASQGNISFEYPYIVKVQFPDIEPIPEGATAYITQVFDYMPAVGQFTNKMPTYEDGDTQTDMNAKVLEKIGNNNNSMITLGGYGGYVTVGFDHTIENKKGLRDFRVLGNAFYANANPDPNAPKGGSCEPGIIMVAFDANGNKQPDDNEWYEIAGSSHVDVSKETFYQKGVDAGNDMNFYRNYQITYHRPAKEPETDKEKAQYIRWTDNKGDEGYMTKNSFHSQPYFPQWAEGDKLTFKGSRLPENGIDESGAGSYYVLYKFRYGYADNDKNNADGSAIDIDWAVNAKGQTVKLPGIDFIKIYGGVNQENGWLGECSTEVTGINDLHMLEEEIPSGI